MDGLHGPLLQGFREGCRRWRLEWGWRRWWLGWLWLSRWIRWLLFTVRMCGGEKVGASLPVEVSAVEMVVVTSVTIATSVTVVERHLRLYPHSVTVTYSVTTGCRLMYALQKSQAL